MGMIRWFRVVLLFVMPAVLSAEALFSPTWGFIVDPPEGHEYSGGNGRDRFSFQAAEGAVLDGRRDSRAGVFVWSWSRRIRLRERAGGIATTGPCSGLSSWNGPISPQPSWFPRNTGTPWAWRTWKAAVPGSKAEADTPEAWPEYANADPRKAQFSALCAENTPKFPSGSCVSKIPSPPNLWQLLYADLQRRPGKTGGGGFEDQSVFSGSGLNYRRCFAREKPADRIGIGAVVRRIAVAKSQDSAIAT